MAGNDIGEVNIEDCVCIEDGYVLVERTARGAQGTKGAQRDRAVRHDLDVEPKGGAIAQVIDDAISPVANSNHNPLKARSTKEPKGPLDERPATDLDHWLRDGVGKRPQADPPAAGEKAHRREGAIHQRPSAGASIARPGSTKPIVSSTMYIGRPFTSS